MSTSATPNPSRTGRTMALIVIGAIIAAIVVWVAVGVVRTLTRPDASGTWELEERFDSVALDGDLADVRIAYGDVDHGELTLRQGDSLERLELDHEVRGDTLHVSLRHVREFGLPQLWLPWWSGARSPELDLVLPAALEGGIALDVNTDVGDVRADGAFDAVEARSNVGDIELTGSAASLDVHNAVGEVEVIGFSTDGDLTAQSGVGDVTLDLESLPTRVEVETETGELTVSLPEGRYAVDADTSIGDLDLDVANDPSADRRYEFTTSIGDVSITN
ncbi:DUF4097 family beta strand repeat-containing protein [Agromyces bauzanensis]